MKPVYLVRHEESEMNVRNYSHGDGNSPLTEKGRQQAEAIAERCVNISFDTIIASSMRRAQETAEAISLRIGKSVESSDLFRERKPPLVLESNERYKEPLLSIRNTWLLSFYTDSSRVEDGENFSDIKKRAAQALSYLESRSEERILVVAHSFILHTMLTHVIFGDDFTPEELKKIILRVDMDNTAISILEFDPAGVTYDTIKVAGWFVRTWNDHAHLG